jgi:hypothetical protein
MFSAMDAAETPDVERLRRHLRAMGAVNRQLHAQLEGGTVRLAEGAGAPQDDPLATPDGLDGGMAAITVRRASVASAWLEQLQLQGGGKPSLVRTPKRGMFVVEGTLRREIKSGLIFLALARAFGEPRQMRESELERLEEGPPVEVLEGGTGPAFVVVGGRRWPIRGLPLPYLVSTREMLSVPEAEELNVAAALASPSTQIKRVRAVVAREGFGRGGLMLFGKAARRGWRKAIGRSK